MIKYFVGTLNSWIAIPTKYMKLIKCPMNINDFTAYTRHLTEQKFYASGLVYIFFFKDKLMNVAGGYCFCLATHSDALPIRRQGIQIISFY